VLVQRCESVLRMFVADQRRSGRCPLESWRISELVLVMRMLGKMEVRLLLLIDQQC